MTEQRCRRCSTIKPLDAFAISRQHRIGRVTTCNECKDHYRELRAARRRARLLDNEYGLTLDEYERMVEQQSGQCAICHTTDPHGPGCRFHVDRDHETGNVRALLCNACNRGIGYLKDDPRVVEAALVYLRPFKGAESL